MENTQNRFQISAPPRARRTGSNCSALAKSWSRGLRLTLCNLTGSSKRRMPIHGMRQSRAQRACDRTGSLFFYGIGASTQQMIPEQSWTFPSRNFDHFLWRAKRTSGPATSSIYLHMNRSWGNLSHRSLNIVPSFLRTRVRRVLVLSSHGTRTRTAPQPAAGTMNEKCSQSRRARIVFPPSLPPIGQYTTPDPRHTYQVREGRGNLKNSERRVVVRQPTF